jgi:hypothetical protein
MRNRRAPDPQASVIVGGDMTSRSTQLQENGSAAAVRGPPQEMQIGGVLALVGGLGYFAVLIVHGDLPDATTELALEHIAARPEWRLLKLAAIVSLLCWLGGFVALVRSLGDGAGALLGRWAVACATIGVTIVIVEYAIVGYALKDVALAWTRAPGPERGPSLGMAQVMLAISGGLFHSFVAWMLGLPSVLLGIAIAQGRRYPTWLGWSAAVAGGGALVAGVSRFLGFAVVPYGLLYGGFVLPLSLWVAVMGVLMWRRGAAPQRPAMTA